MEGWEEREGKEVNEKGKNKQVKKQNKQTKSFKDINREIVY
jgi:hypothetical protein